MRTRCAEWCRARLIFANRIVSYAYSLCVGEGVAGGGVDETADRWCHYRCKYTRPRFTWLHIAYVHKKHKQLYIARTQWRRQDLLRGGAQLEIRSYGTHGELHGRVQQLLDN